MTEGDGSGIERTCASCGERLPASRSVCAACGTLQPASRPAAVVPSEGYGVAHPTLQVPVVVGDETGATGATGATGTGIDGWDDDEDPGGRRRPVLAVLAIAALVVAACTAAAVVRRNDHERTPTPSSQDPRVEAIRGFCADPDPLTGPGKIAAYEPGAGVVAFVRIPQPASSTTAADDLAIQVAPQTGKPLLFDESAGFVSVAACLEETGTEPAGSTCRYERTDAGSFGEEQSARLLRTTYRVELRALRTGKVLQKGSLATDTTRCPELAYLDDDTGVSNALTQDQVVGWIAEQVGTGSG